MVKLRLGIVGAGRHGSRYARHAARDIDEIELVAICRRSEQLGRQTAQEFGCEYVSDADALIARRDIDAVVLVTLPSLLERLVECAVAHRKPLLIEKPVAPDLETGKRIRQTIAGSQLFCMAGHTLRFNSVCRQMAELVPDLGRIDSAIFSQRFPPQLDLAWLDDPKQSGGGNILHTGVHCFDLIRYLTGLEPLTAACVTRRVFTRRTEDCFSSVLTLGPDEAAAVASVSCSRTTACRNGLIEISGEHGQLVGDHVLNRLVRLDAEGAHDLAVDAPRHTVLECLHRFAADLAKSGPPAISYDDGLAAVAVADACYRAAASGRRGAVVLHTRGP